MILKYFTGFIKWVFYLFLVTIFFFETGCRFFQENGIVVKKSQLKENNNLIYQVDLILPAVGDVFIEYYQVHDTCRHYSDLFTGKNARISLLGLKPLADYEYIIHARIKEKIYNSKAYKFSSGELPAGLPEFTLRGKSYSFNGFILLKTFFNPGALILIDDNANIRWYHLYDTTTVRAFNLTPDWNILSLVDSSYLEIRNLYDELVHEYQTSSSGIDRFHHDVILDEAKNIIGLSYTRKIMDLTSKGGQKNDTVNGDGIIVLNPDGNKIWEWNVFDHAEPLKDDSLLYLKKDWVHANSINFDQDGNFLLSLRNINQIWKIDRTTGDVLWRFGIGGDFLSKSENLRFIHQHDVHINRFGDLMMFDNGLINRGFSRILSFKYNKNLNHWEPVLNIKLDKDHTTFRMGSARFIDNEHILVSSPKRFMQISVINTGGEILWNVMSNKSSYRAIYLEPGILYKRKWF